MTYLDHATIVASNLDRSVAFYDAALGALDIGRIAEYGDEEDEDAPVDAVAWGTPERALLWVVTGVMLLLCAGCAAERAHPEHDPEAPPISADQLGDAFEDDATADFLEPQEREALHRVQTPHVAEAGDDPKPAPAPPQGRVARALDDVGKLGVALLSVGITVGAFIAPLFLL